MSGSDYIARFLNFLLASVCKAEANGHTDRFPPFSLIDTTTDVALRQF